MRSTKQIRTEACYHEAGHAVVAYLGGFEIASVLVLSEEEIDATFVLAREEEVDAEAIGRVELTDQVPSDLDQAIGSIMVAYAGQAAAHVAFAVGMVSDVELGGTVRPDSELDVEQIVSARNGDSPTARAVAHASYLMPSEGDDAWAREVAEEWTGDALEAQALLGFCWRRLANTAETSMFQRSVHWLADLLLEQGRLTGEFVTERVLDRMAGMTGRIELINNGRKR